MIDGIFNSLFERYPELEVCRADIGEMFEALAACFEGGGKLLCCGNGGSAADCDHFVGELMKGFLKKRPLSSAEKEKFGASPAADRLQKGLPAISLCAHSALITAFANDVSAELVFAQQVYSYAKPGDILLCLSTSGNSANTFYAAEAAQAAGIKTVSITGENKSKLYELSTVCVRLPEKETYRIQELTLPVYHCLAAMLEERFFKI